MLSNYKIFLFFILLQPIVNSITGMSFVFHYPSIVGPLFYMMILLFSIVYLLYIKNFNIVVTMLLFNIYFLFLFFTNRVGIGGYFDILKVILPFIVFLYAKNLNLTNWKLLLIIKKIKKSFMVYSFLIILSFLISFHIQPDLMGYFGFIHAGNDLILLLMFSLFFYSILKKKSITSEIFIFSSYLLTLSKSIFIFGLVYLGSFVNKKNILLIVVLLLLLLHSVIIPLFDKKIFSYFSDANNILDIYSEYKLKYILNIFTFGRSHFMFDIFSSDLKTFLDYIVGSGTIGAYIITNGKIGAEMDPVDAYNIYGIVGLFFLILFYYIPIYRLNIPLKSKLLFTVIVIYSIIGGHFYNNPLIGFYYGLILGLLQNKNLFELRSFFEISNSHKYTSTI